MLRYKLLSGLTILLFKTACGGTTYVCPDGTTVKAKDQCPSDTESDENVTDEARATTDDVTENTSDTEDASETTGENATVETEAQGGEITEKVASLFETGRERTASLKYVYNDDTYFVHGDKVKIALQQERNYKQTQPYSHVYLDTSAETATGVCEAEDESWCPEVTTHDVDFDEYYHVTPLEWYDKVSSASYGGTGMQLEQRETHVVHFTTGERNGTMYLLNYYNIPAKVEFGDETIRYRDVAVNAVSRGDVTR